MFTSSNEAGRRSLSEAVTRPDYDRVSTLGDVPRADYGGEMIDSQPSGEVGGIGIAPQNSIRNISIEPLNSGYIVRVGCQNAAVETTETLLAALTKYLNNPDDFERAWYSNNNRNKLQNIL